MAQAQQIKKTEAENTKKHDAEKKMLISRKRLVVLSGVLMVLFVLLLVRVGYWTVVRGADLESEAQSQWISDTIVRANRGSILDRGGNVLAQSAGADTVVFQPQSIKDADAVAGALSEILDMDRDELYAKASTKVRTDSKGNTTDIVEVWIKRQITAEQSEQIEALGLEGVKLISDVQRYYPNRSLAAQVIGYTSLDGDGQTGIERRFNSVLEGRAGRTMAETDPLQNDIPNGDEMIIEAVDGQDVILTLNEVVQSYMEDACSAAREDLGADSVQGTVMELAGREILAMANAPAFDLNEPPRSNSEQLAREGTNVVTARAFEPGAFFALFTAAAAYDAHETEGAYSCTGTATFDGTEITCSAIHGTQTFDEAVENQCLIAAAEMAAATGIQNFYSYLDGFGFGKTTGIEFTSDNPGVIMEMKYASEAETARMGSGAALKVTQLQLIDALAALLDAGTVKTPQLVLELRNADGTAAETYKTQTVSEAVSAASSEHIRGILAKAETAEGDIGTLQASVLQPQDSLENAGSECVNLFAAFAPAENPKYLVLMTGNGDSEAVRDEEILRRYAVGVLTETLQYFGIPVEQEKAQPSRSAEPAGTLSPIVQVPRLVGLTLANARERCAEEGLELTANGTGTVIGQYPYAGTQVDRGSEVQLEMSSRTSQGAVSSSLPGGQTTVPNFTGMTFEEAMERAYDAGLTFMAQGTGIAVAQTPVAGAAVERGATVTVTFRIDVD